jgi:hypothetical protein
MNPELQYRQSVILWMAMLVSIGMYFVVVRLVPPQQATDNPALVNTLLVAALGLVAASFAVKSHFLQRGRDLGKPAFFRMALIVALVLCEAGALLGVVAWFLTGSSRSYWMLLIGFIGMLLHYPPRESS